MTILLYRELQLGQEENAVEEYIKQILQHFIMAGIENTDILG